MRVVVLGASGTVGAFFSRFLAESGSLAARIDLTAKESETLPGRYLSADVTVATPELEAALALGDSVLVCLPGDTAKLVIPIVLGAVRKSILWVDTVSIKSPVCSALERFTDTHELLSINPMVSPSAKLRGSRVAVITLKEGPLGGQFLRLLTEQGALLTHLSAVDHDRLTASIQVATHAAALSFGIALLRSGYDSRSIANLCTPPHLLLMAVLARITSLNPSVYWEIQTQHPAADTVRRDLASAIQELDSLIRSGDAANFRRLLGDLRCLVEPEQKALSKVFDAAAVTLRSQSSECGPK